MHFLECQLHYLFAEELGILLEVDCDAVDQVVAMYIAAGVSCELVGYSLAINGPDAGVCNLELKFE